MENKDNVYSLIASTSNILKKSLIKLGPHPKYPRIVTEITNNLKDVYDCRGAVNIMKEFVRINEL